MTEELSNIYQRYNGDKKAYEDDVCFNYLNPITSKDKNHEIVIAIKTYEYHVDLDNKKGRMIHFSILNQRMIDFDYMYFIEHDKEIINFYKPYYYGMEVYVSDDENHYSNKAFGIIEDEINTKGWVLLELRKETNLDFSEEYRKKFKHNSNDFSIEKIDNDCKKIYEDLESEKLKIAEDNIKTFVGYSTVSSITNYQAIEKNISMHCVDYKNKQSIKHYIEKALKIQFATDDDRNSLKRLKSLDMSKIPENIESVDFTVYNVGQANFVLGVTNDKTSFVFDAGIPNSKVDNRDNLDLIPQINKFNAVIINIFEIKKLKPDYCIISHWHYDHMKGYFLMEKEDMLNAVWIFPELKGDYDPNKYRLSNFLEKNGAQIIYNKNGKKIFSNSWLDVFIGKGGIGYNNNTPDINKEGIIFLVLDKCILPGDCEYKCWPEELKNNSLFVTDLIVPHHGGYADFRVPKDLPKFNANLKKTAYLSTGYCSDMSKFPNKYQIQHLIGKWNFEVINTRNRCNYKGKGANTPQRIAICFKVIK